VVDDGRGLHRAKEGERRCVAVLGDEEEGCEEEADGGARHRQRERGGGADAMDDEYIPTTTFHRAGGPLESDVV